MCYAISEKGKVHIFENEKRREETISQYGGTWILLDKPNFKTYPLPKKS